MSCVDAGEVSLDRQGLGSGYIAHPAVTDNAMQMGPASANFQRSTYAEEGTRVVAGFSAYQVIFETLKADIVPTRTQLQESSCLIAADHVMRNGLGSWRRSVTETVDVMLTYCTSCHQPSIMDTADTMYTFLCMHVFALLWSETNACRLSGHTISPRWEGMGHHRARACR